VSETKNKRERERRKLLFFRALLLINRKNQFFSLFSFSLLPPLEFMLTTERFGKFVHFGEEEKKFHLLTCHTKRYALTSKGSDRERERKGEKRGRE